MPVAELQIHGTKAHYWAWFGLFVAQRFDGIQGHCLVGKSQQTTGHSGISNESSLDG
jgi:hypothetical protein